MTSSKETKSGIRFLWDGVELSQNDIKDGTILIMKFKVNKNAQSGKYPITLKCSDGEILESRLDNVVYRLGFGASRAQARQLVNHGQFEVNGKKVDIPSYLVKAGDVITVRENKKENATIKANVEANAARPVPAWLELNNETLSGKVVRLASREDVDIPVEEHLIVELYSK